MKRTQLRRTKPFSRSPGGSSAPPKRKTGLRSSSPVRAAAGRTSRPKESGQEEWQKKRWGRCAICGTYGRVVFHHVVEEAAIRKVTTPAQQAAGVCWDSRNALRVGAPLAFGGSCACHSSHHLPGVRDTRISYGKLRAETLEFAEEVLGWGPATEHFRRHYRDAP